jgi:hypothetical protein
MNKKKPNTACTRLVGVAALKRALSLPELFSLIELGPRPPTSG